MCDRFTTIEDITDNRVKIVKDKITGFLNASYTLNRIAEIYSDVPKKRMNNWLRSNGTQELINSIRDMNGLTEGAELIINITDVPNKYRGSYVHEDVYRAFAFWAHTEYAARSIRILSSLQEDKIRNLELERTTLVEKMDQQAQTMKEQTEMIKNLKRDNLKQTEQFEALMAHTANVHDEVIGARGDISLLTDADY